MPGEQRRAQHRESESAWRQMAAIRASISRRWPVAAANAPPVRGDSCVTERSTSSAWPVTGEPGRLVMATVIAPSYRAPRHILIVPPDLPEAAMATGTTTDVEG